jgi:hypothetical protein
MSDDQNKYWVLPLHLRIHQITTKHRPVVLNEDYELARELLREIAGHRQAVAFFAPQLAGIIGVLSRIDAFLAATAPLEQLPPDVS